VAVIQISRIQQRRGQTAQTGFPQLASGEFGWSIDTQELYIGNGAVSEGAPAVGNTRLLTENDSNFFLFVNNGYTYGDSLSDLVPNVISRSVQSKLDDIVNLNDFIPVDSTATDQTAFIQSAISYSAGIKKPLYVPEGTYLVTGTIFIPPYAEIRGAGKNKTVLTAFETTATMFQTIDGAGNQFPSLTSGENTPKNVKIAGLSFLQTATNGFTILSLDCVSDSTVEDCGFTGADSSSTQAPSIRLRGQGSLTCDNISIKDCVFDSLNYGIICNYDAANLNVINNKFNNLHYGIRFNYNLSLTTGSTTGADNVNIINNQFSNINNYGIYIGPNTTGKSVVKSSKNSFVNVGNGYRNSQGELSQRTSVVYFGNTGCSSTGDDFTRLKNINTGSITAFSAIRPTVYGPSVFTDDTTNYVSLATTGTYNVFVWPRASFTYTVTNLSSPGQVISLDYSINKPTGNITRRGILKASINGSTATVVDNFTYYGSNDGLVTFTVDLTRADVIIVKASNTGPRGVLSYTPTVRQ
jgi:hypothetical protein